ncbi:MAG TPA: hypothetical protein VIF10_01200 [Methylobacter sp.]|jgi:hypothetical protein
MNKWFVMAVLLSASLVGHAESVKFEKANGTLEMASTQSGLTFTLNAVNGQSACEAEGTAITVDDHRAAYTSNDKKDLCVILFDFKSESSINVVTKDCAAYCGTGAAGSMDGLYKK